jgi:hypothetical protein
VLVVTAVVGGVVIWSLVPTRPPEPPASSEPAAAETTSAMEAFLRAAAPLATTPERRSEPPTPAPVPPSPRPRRSPATERPAPLGPAQADAVGRLVVQSHPPARVILDGRDTGRRTPLQRLELPAGRHRLELQTAQGDRRAMNVEIRRGETTRVVVSLGPRSSSDPANGVVAHRIPANPFD